MTKPIYLLKLFIAALSILVTQSCKKNNVPEQGELIVSASQINLYHPSVEFSIYITNKPEITDTWEITKLPYFLVTEKMSGTINKSITELKFKFNPEMNHVQNSTGTSIEILTKHSGAATIKVNYYTYRIIDVDFLPEHLHFMEGDTIKHLKIQNNTANQMGVRLHPQYPWIRFPHNYSGEDYFGTNLSALRETNILVELNLEYEGLELGRNNNMLLIEVWNNETTHMYIYEITADIPSIKRIKVNKNSLLFNYNDSVISLSLYNTGNVPISWIASCDADFVISVPAQGIIPGNEQVNLEIKIDRASLSHFEYETQIRFNWDEGVVDIPIAVLHDPALWSHFPSVISIDYSKAIDKIILITEAKAFILYDPVTHQQQEIPSLHGATSFRLNKEGTFAIVAKQQQIARLNLSTLVVDNEQTFPVTLTKYKFYGSDDLYYYNYEYGANYHHYYLNLNTSETAAYQLEIYAANMEKNPNQPILYANIHSRLYTYNITTTPGQLVGTTLISSSPSSENWIDYYNNLIFDGGHVLNINTPPGYIPELITDIYFQGKRITHVHSSEELQTSFLLYDKIRAHSPEQNYAFIKEYELPSYVSFENGDYILKNPTGFFCFTRQNDLDLYVIAKDNTGNHYFTTLNIEE